MLAFEEYLPMTSDTMTSAAPVISGAKTLLPLFSVSLFAMVALT